jgi:hypothetical protein
MLKKYYLTSFMYKKDVPSVVGSRTMWGLEEVISGRSLLHIVQCVEATARTCDLLVHRRHALGLPFYTLIQFEAS